MSFKKIKTNSIIFVILLVSFKKIHIVCYNNKVKNIHYIWNNRDLVDLDQLTDGVKGGLYVTDASNVS